jgi:hypothetical protein
MDLFLTFTMPNKCTMKDIFHGTFNEINLMLVPFFYKVGVKKV